ncbi:hypothetical protein R1sor_026327 [Riccia sorocarpa]|uniref:DSBA-like thioredoxin domain-containing protein n=1 Tax=Riccia sorocarpa TaxID=122646 RepID=A0ABD3GD52_9MARC
MLLEFGSENTQSARTQNQKPVLQVNANGIKAGKEGTAWSKSLEEVHCHESHVSHGPVDRIRALYPFLRHRIAEEKLKMRVAAKNNGEDNQTDGSGGSGEQVFLQSKGKGYSNRGLDTGSASYQSQFRFDSSTSFQDPWHGQGVFWCTGRRHYIDLNDASFILQCLVNAGLSKEESQRFLQKANDGNVKKSLQKTTDIAVEKGAFGAPSMFVYLQAADVEKQWQEETPDHFIFGSDRLEQLAFALNKKWEGPAPKPLSKL